MKIGGRALALAIVSAVYAYEANGAEIVGKIPATKDWFEYKISWFGGSASYQARWYVMQKGGAVAVCGVGAYIDNSMRSQTDAILRDLGFYIGEALYLTDMKFFARVNRPSDLIGATANCATTGKPPPKEKNVSLRSTKPYKRY